MIKKKLVQLKERKLTVFVIVFSISITLLLLTGSLIAPQYSEIFRWAGNSHFSSSINKKHELKRNVTVDQIKDDPSSFEIVIAFLDKKDESGNMVARVVTVDFFTEGYVPFIIFIALMIAFPYETKKKIIPFIIGAVIIQVYIIFKLTVISYDNFNYPELQLINLSGIFEFVVYYLSKFYNITGFSTTVIFPVVVFSVVEFKNIIGLIPTVEEASK